MRVPDRLRLQQGLGTNVTIAGTEESALAGLTPEVIAQLVDGQALFLAFVQRRVGARAIAEDILQEAFARALARGDNLRDGESAVAWFYRLLRNALIDHHRAPLPPAARSTRPRSKRSCKATVRTTT